VCAESGLWYLFQRMREREKIIKENGIYGICNKKNRGKKIQV
jgi:hypothetical protein